LVLVIEIKGEDDFEKVTKAKDEAGKSHFKDVNVQLQSANPINYPNLQLKQYYIFELLRPDFFDIWASQVKYGNFKI